MKHHVLIFITPLLLATVLSAGCSPADQADANGIEWISLEEAQRLSSKDGKKIMIDVYTDWCEYCKKLEENVYPDSSVVRNLNKFYHLVKLNAESDDEIRFKGELTTHYDLAKSLGVRSYPTILFLDSHGDLILQINGYMPASDFTNMLVYIGEEAYNKTEFHEFASGIRNR